MISERSFACSFSGFWSELLPLLTPSFVHMVNDGLMKELTDGYRVPIEAVAKSGETRNAAAVAEFAFVLAGRAADMKRAVDELYVDSGFRESVALSALEAVARYEGSSGRRVGSLSARESEEGVALARNYERFFEQRCGGHTIEFGPEIPGAGFLAACRADISVDTCLFEVKTVNRNLAGKDIRQLIVYLALQAATGQRRWRTGGFFNPRRAVYQEFEVDDLIARMTGGRSAGEVFQDLISFVCTRDLQLDTLF